MLILVLAFSIVVYLATGSPLVASLLSYSVTAWPSLRTAFWLLANDPVRHRGWACFWFYLATAGWRAAVAAFSSVLIFGVIHIVTGAGPDIDEFGRTMIVLMAGLGMATLVGIVGLASAWHNQVRVFVIPNLRDVCRGDFTAIGTQTSSHQRMNHAIFVLTSSLFVPVLLLAATFSIWSFNGERPNEQSPLLMFATSTILFGPLAMIPVYYYLSNRIVAPVPSDCWSLDSEAPWLAMTED